jgi:cyclic pyranopterin phosphate synthase
VSRSDLLTDSLGRVIRDLRVSLTDRCNFRCLYCSPPRARAAALSRAGFVFRQEAPAWPPPPVWPPRAAILTFAELERVIRLAVGLGIRKVRLTGGEPLLRQGVEGLVARLARIPGLADLAMTSNGSVFPQKGRALRAAGLRRISLSLDSLAPANFKRITGRDGLREVLASIALARQLGLEPVKLNAVIVRGLNDHQVEPLADFAQANGLNLRFIEFMPLDASRAWTRELVVPGREILARLQERFRLVAVKSANPAETARRWAFADGPGELGIIAPVTEPFCAHCNRLRLTVDGKVRTCLFSQQEHDLKPLLRRGASDEELRARLRAIVLMKEAGHRLGQPRCGQPRRPMSCIGG